MKSNRYCVIMAGGIGSRFWPLSTMRFPKQFQDILGIGKTLIQQTFERILPTIPVENIYVITNEEYIDLCKEQLPDLPQENIVGEPVAKNTAACNLYMACKIAQINPEANIVVLPADHLIIKEERFNEKIVQALELAAKNDYLVTLGIKATRPDTGYGYIQYLPTDNSAYYKVKTFTEKPSLEIAKTFLESGDFLWNAGIFIWNVQSILKAFNEYLPDMVIQFRSCEYNTDKEIPCIQLIYPKLPKIPIDTGILEKAHNVYVFPADLGWSDLGTWTSVYENVSKDEDSNAINSKNVLTSDSKGNMIHIKDKNKGAIIDGLNGYIVVDTEKALLICPIENDQKIKEHLTVFKN